MERTFEPALEAPTALGGTRLWFCVRGAELLVVENGETAEFPLADDLGTLGLVADTSHFLGLLDGVGCMAAVIDDAAEPPAGAAFTELRPLWTRLRPRASDRRVGPDAPVLRSLRDTHREHTR
jgi:NAD+ diphosphatase